MQYGIEDWVPEKAILRRAGLDFRVKMGLKMCLFQGYIEKRSNLQTRETEYKITLEGLKRQMSWKDLGGD